jgi:hypothetical protein
MLGDVFLTRYHLAGGASCTQIGKIQYVMVV